MDKADQRSVSSAMKLLEPHASKLPTREQENAQEQPVEPGRTILVFEHAS